MRAAENTSQLDWVNRRDLGIERARRRAERECGHEWTESAATYLRLYALNVAQCQPFLLEDARQASYGRVSRPTNEKAWGAAAQFAARRGWIEKAGYGAARSSNGSPKVQWRAVVA